MSVSNGSVPDYGTLISISIEILLYKKNVVKWFYIEVCELYIKSILYEKSLFIKVVSKFLVLKSFIQANNLIAFVCGVAREVKWK